MYIYIYINQQSRCLFPQGGARRLGGQVPRAFYFCDAGVILSAWRTKDTFKGRSGPRQLGSAPPQGPDGCDTQRRVVVHGHVGSRHLFADTLLIGNMVAIVFTIQQPGGSFFFRNAAHALFASVCSGLVEQDSPASPLSLTVWAQSRTVAGVDAIVSTHRGGSSSSTSKPAHVGHQPLKLRPSHRGYGIPENKTLERRSLVIGHDCVCAH
jgi:hypothetical protein